MKTVQYTTTGTAFRDTHHPQIRPSIQRITLPMPLQPRKYVVLIHHSIYSLTVCIVGKHVTYVRIQKIQIDGGRPICVDQLYRSRTNFVQAIPP